MRIEQLIIRDPDYATEVITFIDGVPADRVEGLVWITEQVDPGAGYDGAEWDEETEATRANDSLSPAFRARVVEARETYADNQYIER
jgi:hypothetical protein